MRAIIEAMLLATPEPLTIGQMAEVLGLDEVVVSDCLKELRGEYDRQRRGFEILEIAGGFQLHSRPQFAPYLEKLFPQPQGGLSHAALETLAIIAFRQPVTRADIEAIRGVRVDRCLTSLLERKLIREVGRKEGLGRPILYGTTREFLQHFGLKDLVELPDPGAPGELTEQLDSSDDGQAVFF